METPSFSIMSNLYELGLEYEESARKLKERLKQLRAMRAKNPSAVLDAEIYTFQKMLTDTNKIARYCKHYYEKGFYIGGGAFSREVQQGNFGSARKPCSTNVQTSFERERGFNNSQIIHGKRAATRRNIEQHLLESVYQRFKED